MRQYAGYASAKASNERYRYLLDQGQTGLSVAFDLPTQLGLDSSDERADGEVGKVGVAIDCLDDMLTLFDGIPLDKVTTSMASGSPRNERGAWGIATTPSGRSSTCSAGMITSSGSAASHRRAAMFTAVPM
jgi:methylmalonyl-CoA mutase N-terminal domain/subunit